MRTIDVKMPRAAARLPLGISTVTCIGAVPHEFVQREGKEE